MNKFSSRFLLAHTLLAASSALACGPFFPISYTEPTAIDGTFTNLDWRVWSGYEVRLNPNYELALLGRHFFPEWAGRKLRHVTMTPAEAHRADYAEAATAAGMTSERIAARTEVLLGFTDAAKARLEAGEGVGVPPDLENFEREFFLYALGRAQRLADETLTTPSAWRELLALPPESRRFRTVWVRHGLVLAAPDVSFADRRLSALRKDLDAGFRDTCGLEEAIVAQLLRRGRSPADRLHWLPLAAVATSSPRIAAALVADVDWMRRSDGWYRTFQGNVRNIVASDPVATEVLVTLGGERLLPDDLRGAAPVLCADRRAWAAFQEGDFERGRKLLALAPEKSLVRLFWEARLARIDGDYARSAELLRTWLAEVVKRGGVPHGVFEVHDSCEGWFNDTESEKKPRTRSVERIVEGELGGVLITQGDFEEALLAFLRARSWIDAAFVAERCVTVDALADIVRRLPKGASSWKETVWHWHSERTVAEELSWLTARRFLREGHIGEAGEFFPKVRKPEWRLYASLIATARPDEPLSDPIAKDDARALASFNLARLLFVRGMELLGTELEPDVHTSEGDYSYSGIGDRELGDLPHSNPLPPPLPPRPETRFHYRALADEAARRAAALATDPDIRVAALLLRGEINLIAHAPSKNVESAYRELCAVRGHPLAKAAREANWFPWKTAEPFLGKLTAERQDSQGLPISRALSVKELRSLLRTP